MYTSAEGESTSQPVLFCCEIWLELVGLSGKTGKQKVPSNFIITFGIFLYTFADIANVALFLYSHYVFFVFFPAIVKSFGIW